MAKKLSLLLATAAVLAFAVPAFASAAETGLTQEGVGLVPTGKIITGTNILNPNTGTKNVLTTSTKLGTIECETVMLEAELKTNSLTKVVAEESTSSKQSATVCKRAGAKVEVFGIKLSKLESVGKEAGGGLKEGTATASFEVELSPGGTICKFSGTADVGTYTPGSDVITIKEGALTVTPIACGTTAKLDGSFTMTTKETTTPVTLM